MSKNYAKGKPLGNNGVPFYDSPAAETAIAVVARDNASASSILILNNNTTAVQIGTVGAPAVVKWLTQATVDSSVAGTSVISAAGTANFDHFVPSASNVRLVVPIAGSASHDGAQVGANVANNLYTHMAYKTGGVGSVAAIQN